MGRHEPLPVPSSVPSVMQALGHFDRETLGAAVEVLIALLDTFDSQADPDEPDFSPRSDGQPGDPGDHEPGGDEEQGAYAEWTSLLSSQRRSGTCLVLKGHGNEDDELTGDETDGVGAEDEECGWFRKPGQYAGCPIADPGGSQASEE